MCWAGTWHLRHSTLPDEEEQGGTVVEHKPGELLEQMLYVEGRAAEPSLEGVVGQKSYSEGLEPGDRKPGQTERCTGVLKEVEWFEDDERLSSEMPPSEASSETQTYDVADRSNSVG